MTVELESDGPFLRARDGAHVLPWSAVRERLAGEDPALREALTARLRASEHAALYWECRPWPPGDDPPWECALLPAPALAPRPARRAAFAGHFASARGPLVVFPNLRGDATLVVPTPRGDGSDAEAGHLVAWLLAAPDALADGLWRRVAEEIARWREAGRGTLWVSTSGGGVPWLHVRLDSSPKYYRHRPYRQA